MRKNRGLNGRGDQPTREHINDALEAADISWVEAESRNRAQAMRTGRHLVDEFTVAWPKCLNSDQRLTRSPCTTFYISNVKARLVKKP